MASLHERLEDDVQVVLLKTTVEARGGAQGKGRSYADLPRSWKCLVVALPGVGKANCTANRLDSLHSCRHQSSI